VTWLWLTLATFLLSALPFSVWLGKLRGTDVRAVGDGNPGATNALRAGGWQLGLAVLMLDVSKSAAPVGLAYQILGIRGAGMWAICTAAVLGHAYSPFLKFLGGKALATMLGVWIGLTLWKMPLVLLAMIVLWKLLIRPDGWTVLITIVIGLGFLLVVNPDPLFLAVIGFQMVLVVWKHRGDLAMRPEWKRRVRKVSGT
jgi:acyl phosphate:glycerol-3-phosphate acyltransferase